MAYLLGAGARQPLIAPRMGLSETEIALEDVPLPERPLALEEPVPAQAPANSALPRVAARAMPRARPRSGETPEVLSVPADDGHGQGSVLPQRPASGAGERRLTLEDLGVGPSRRIAALAPAPAAPVDRDVGGLRQGLLNRDTELGLGPGGKIADELGHVIRDIAPIGSTATVTVVVNESGAVQDVSLRDATGDSPAWVKALETVSQKVKRISPWPGGAFKITLGIRSVSAPRAGKARDGDGITFDVSNIGSPSIHHFHVYVLDQARY